MILFYDLLLTLLKPLIYVIGQIELPKRKITGLHYQKYKSQLSLGMVFLTKTDWEVQNFLNPCKIKHGAIFVGEIFGDGIDYVFESVAEGAILTELVEFMLTKDLIVGCEFKHHKEILQSEIQKTVLRLKGTPYDYLFDKGGKALYCFELAAVCLNDVFPSANFKCREILKGKKIYDPDTFLDENFFEVKFDSRKDVI